jgi:hypothetical protein
MGTALYQLLLLPDTIPSEFSEVKGIIARHASHRDGFSAMYTIME